jgi:hypothetical protein
MELRAKGRRKLNTTWAPLHAAHFEFLEKSCQFYMGFFWIEKSRSCPELDCLGPNEDIVITKSAQATTPH